MTTPRPRFAQPRQETLGEKLVRRRGFIAAGAAALVAAAFERESLNGRWDHRRVPPSANGGKDLWTRALVELGKPGGADGALVHFGHSTHLVCAAGARMLTDPWFYDPAFGALSHLVGPCVLPEHIGTLHAILVTHEHADHLDPVAVDRLDKNAVAVVATRYLAARMRGLGYASPVVLQPWESIDIGGAKVTAVPGVHDIYEIGFVVQGSGHSIYFAGDTRLFDGLPAIAERFRPTVAILPVDGTRLTGGDLHVMTPDDAVQAARTLGVRAAMPSHAEAEFSDPLVKHALASTIEGAPAKFAEAMSRGLPAVKCLRPRAGEYLALAT